MGHHDGRGLDEDKGIRSIGVVTAEIQSGGWDDLLQTYRKVQLDHRRLAKKRGEA